MSTYRITTRFDLNNEAEKRADEQSMDMSVLDDLKLFV